MIAPPISTYLVPTWRSLHKTLHISVTATLQICLEFAALASPCLDLCFATASPWPMLRLGFSSSTSASIFPSCTSLHNNTESSITSTGHSYAVDSIMTHNSWARSIVFNLHIQCFRENWILKLTRLFVSYASKYHFLIQPNYCGKWTLVRYYTNLLK